MMVVRFLLNHSVTMQNLDECHWYYILNTIINLISFDGSVLLFSKFQNFLIIWRNHLYNCFIIYQSFPLEWLDISWSHEMHLLVTHWYPFCTFSSVTTLITICTLSVITAYSLYFSSQCASTVCGKSWHT